MLRAGLLAVIAVVALSIPRQIVLADVTDGGGYTREVPVELADGEAQVAHGPPPEAEVLRAQNALDVFADQSQVRELVEEKLIDELGLHYPDSREAAFNVYVKRGTDARGVSYVDIVKRRLPSSFEGFPVILLKSEPAGVDLGRAGVMMFGKRAGDAQVTDAPAPDPEVLEAQNALDDFSDLSQVKSLLAENLIDGVGMHYPNPREAALYVSVNRGNSQGVRYVDIVKSRLPSSFEGFPVNFIKSGGP
jgi:hypothetical protein